ncbi:hypothetical protein BECAL_00239 [Bellilinea caldifistulae]|uniref:hypothetical protein n=1 Tax=Bellilinea caldifistulae TaxID=360411 RepID=UPI0007826007|nr:hypothetical protein [Bellilinea caldifistulae]GAP09100.1 hypothetical protein BECAL_00239 [Bellilinea caldifistulae]
MTNSSLHIGRLLRSTTSDCVIGCRASELNLPAFGGMVRIPLAEGTQIFGLIHNIQIEDDGLIRQLITSDNVPPDVLLDNRNNRNVPVEIGVIFIGYQQDGVISHLLPPRPPLSLDEIFTCTPQEVVAFTGNGRFGYLRHILRRDDLPQAELLAAHIQQAGQIHLTHGRPDWVEAVTRELVTLLRDDYDRLMSVLSAIGDINLS